MTSVMGLVLIFVLGIVNFAMHKAVLESGHPLLREAPVLLQAMGGRFSLAVEFLILLSSLVLVNEGARGWGWGYAAYSLVNALSAWLILSRRI